MGKIKTHKATAKRFMVKRSKRNGTVKLLKRPGGQDHFNSREPGKVTRTKRVDTAISDTVRKTLLRAMPYV